MFYWINEKKKVVIFELDDRLGLIIEFIKMNENEIDEFFVIG